MEILAVIAGLIAIVAVFSVFKSRPAVVVPARPKWVPPPKPKPKPEPKPVPTPAPVVTKPEPKPKPTVTRKSRRKDGRRVRASAEDKPFRGKF